jgi:hypothetical protein
MAAGGYRRAAAGLGLRRACGAPGASCSCGAGFRAAAGRRPGSARAGTSEATVRANATQNVVSNACARTGRARAGSAAVIAAAPPMLPWKPGRAAVSVVSGRIKYI